MERREHRFKFTRRSAGIGITALLALAALAAAGSAFAMGPVKEPFDITKLCGTQKIKVGLADGFGGNSWRKITRAELESEAKKCPNIVLVIFPDSAQALLPVIKEATAQGVKVVMNVGVVGGVAGKDYVANVGEDVKAEGRTTGAWIAKALKGKGNIIMLGGTPGNSYSALVDAGVREVLKKYPGIKELEGPVPTNWDVGNTQKVVAGLLAKYPKIDGIVSDYGGGSVGGIRAFVAAKRPLVPWAANDDNQFSCTYKQYKKTNPNFQIATVSSRNWTSRLALRVGLAALNGVKDTEPQTVTLTLFEDSIAGGKLAPQCVPSLPPDAIISSHLTIGELKKLFK
jgi:ribose transport system substrate-binding protein